jgi:hypothetical protein
MSNDAIAVINEGLVSRTTKSGKQRFHIRIEAEPVIFALDPKALGAPIANAIANHLRERMKAITDLASPATMRARQSAEMAIQAGKQWARQRYAGGRMGGRAPNSSNRLFNDSGRFAESIVAKADKHGAWHVNVAANRLDPTHIGVEAVQKIWAKLVELVPEFANAGAILERNDMIRRTVQRAIRVGQKTDGKASAWDVARAAADLARSAADLFAA